MDESLGHINDQQKTVTGWENMDPNKARTQQESAISEKMKNTDYSGDPTSGSVEIDRFKNAQVDDYGTARAAGAKVMVSK